MYDAHAGFPEQQIINCTDLTTLEDIYLPYKPKRKTRGDKAKEKGLEPLAQLIWDQEITKGDPDEYAKEYLNEELEVTSLVDVWSGATDIVAEWINEMTEWLDG